MRKLLILLLFSLSFTIFSQKEREWKVKNDQGTLYGTFCWQPKKEIQAVALIIAGSGPTDRNGNSGLTQNNALRYLAHDLANQGIATLRYDKQGVGKSSNAAKEEIDLRFDDFVNDALLWLEVLDKKYKKKKRIIIGHSEGALIGKLAAQQYRADGLISIAGAGRPIGTILEEQLETALSDNAQLLNYAKSAIDSLTKGHKVTEVEPMLISLFRPSIQPYLISWMQIDPLEVLKSIGVKSLIIQGSNDLQTNMKDAQRLATAVNATSHTITNMNHVLKEVDTTGPANQMSYMNPDLPLHPELIPTIVNYVTELK